MKSFRSLINEMFMENNEKIDLKKENKFSVFPVLAKVFEVTKFVSSMLLPN